MERLSVYSSAACTNYWAAFGPALAPVLEAGSGDIGVREPLLHLGDVRFKQDRAESLRRMLRASGLYLRATSAMQLHARE